MSDNIKVVVKVRPLIAHEIAGKEQCQWRIENNTLHQIDNIFGQNSFTFDKVYGEKSKTSDIYNDIAKPIVGAALAGFNGTIFAYGQTSSGKTYTMTGTDESPGIIPLAVLDLFETIKSTPGRDFVVSVSYLEIYNETLRDLLDLKKTHLKIQETVNGSIKVGDVTEKNTASPDEVLEAMKEGNANRQTGSTNMNENSSRSHSIFQITIESREHLEGEEQAGSVNVSQLNLVDLAGSERAGQTGATGKRFKEGTHINKSLLSLSHVIYQLTEDATKYINYRDSKLTRILQNSLGGNAKTSIICAVTPAALEETVSTLQFATRAKAIKNKPKVNAVATDATMIQRLTQQLSKLQTQLESKEVILETKKHKEQDLQKQITNLRRFILNAGQRPAVELMGGARKKLQQPRRITISTLHSIEDDVPKIPKFRTPSLKYNPLLIPNQSDFAPIQKPSKLDSLPEEPVRLITPPPTRQVNFSNEVIELDSDDDECSSTSPFHKCQDPSKTPPCVLRKTAKQAERNYKELLEMTDTEKLYPPSIVELMKKIEQSAARTGKLQDQIEVLKTSSNDKDFEIEALRNKINATENEMKSLFSVSLQLENQRKEFNTKLTDWEVSYETLKSKAKLREEELLGLLEEQRIKQTEDIGKIPFKQKDKEIINFMDMSKDISLVNSDNENSIVLPDDGANENANTLMKDLQTQLESKGQMISDLLTDIDAQKQRIETLQKSNQDLLGEVNSFKERLRYIENEKILLQCTIEELNCTVKSQKENRELVQNDIISYQSVIQELQIKLHKKENFLNAHISDTVLEDMLANEEKTIANNENLQNIIHAFKLALENTKIEIESLKTKMQNNNGTGENDSIENTNIKSKQIELLNDEITKLKKHANENILTINVLLEEKNGLAIVEQELIKKITEEEERNREHTFINKELALEVENLKKDINRLEMSLADLSKTKQELSNINEKLVEKNQEASDKVSSLEENIHSKDTLIEYLEKQNTEYQECLNEAKHAIKKLQDILTCEMQDVPEVLDSFTATHNTLNYNINMLEDIVLKTVTQKQTFYKNSIELQKELDNIVLKHKSLVTGVTEENENLSGSLQKCTNEIQLLKDKNNELTNAIAKIELELNDRNTELSKFESQLNLFKEANGKLNDEISEKQSVISSLKDNETELLKKIDQLETETSEKNSLIKSKEEMNQYMSNKDQLTTLNFNELEKELHQKSITLTQTEQKLHETEKSNDQLFENIICKLSDIIDTIKEKNTFIQNSLMNEGGIARESILPILDAVVDYVIMQGPKENQNKELKCEIEKINNFNRTLKFDLELSSKLLEQLKDELKIKASEIVSMEHKVKELKTQFGSFNDSMKEQMLFLQTENDNLKALKVDLSKETKMQIDLHTAEPDAQISSKTSYTMPSVRCETNEQNMSPRSLLTICCERIIESMDSKQSDNNTSASASSSCVLPDASVNACSNCDQLSLEVRMMLEDKNTLVKLVAQLEAVNEELLKEQTQVRDEVRLLLEPTQELQKKIINHRTSLSTLTATTHAENKSLKSQVKGLQHHHSRFHNVCSRDIPEFKKHLNELLTILKDDSSFCDSYKRYSLPNIIENISISNQTKNDSTLDGDLLMLDTNITQTTADNTLVGYNQTCLDLTQTMFNETGVQTIDYNVPEPNMLSDEMFILKNDNEKMSLKLEEFAEENSKLKKQLTNYVIGGESKVDAQISPIKISSHDNDATCTKCKTVKHFLTEKLLAATNEKDSLEKKYNDMVLEMTSTDDMILKIKTLEENINNKVYEMAKITNTLRVKSAELKELQEENDSLSTEVMDRISETDDLNKEVEKLKQENLLLIQQCREQEKSSIIDCPTCNAKETVSYTKQDCIETIHSRLNRSLSDSESTSRHNRICTLQSEIHAGREDCKVLTEDVANIKHDLDQSNIMSMDLDESMADFELANEMIPSPRNKNISDMPNIQEERPQDLYKADKTDCLNYYIEKTGVKKDDVISDTKIIEVMKLLHNNLVTKHSNEVENLVNKLKDHQETQNNLETQLRAMNTEYSKIKNNLEEKDKALNMITDAVTHLKNNLSLITIDCKNSINTENPKNLSDILIEKFLIVLDEKFNLTSVNIFEQFCNKYEYVLNKTKKERDTIQSQIDVITANLKSASNELVQIKSQISEKEIECNLLKARNEKIHEINNALTLDMVNKEEENNKIIKQVYQNIVELNVINPVEIPLTEPLNVQILIRILEHVIEKSKVNVSLEIKNYRVALEEKERVLCGLSHKVAEATELLNTVKSLQDENERLKAVSQVISKENESYASELKQSSATIQQNNTDIDKMSSDILVLRESLKEATAHMEKMNVKTEALLKENTEIKQELEVKSHDRSRLEINIKTHEKTAEIQSRMIMRLQKQIEDEKTNREKQTNLTTDNYASLQNESETLRNTVKTLNEEIHSLKIAKDSLEKRLSELEDSGRKSRASLDAIADSTKRRRQSLHDSKRMFEDLEDHKNPEAVFESGDKADEPFMDVDDDASDRSTPFEHRKGHDSLLSRTDNSDKDEEHPSRPNSVVAIRRRRQSVHDLHRSVTPHAPSPHDLSNYVIDEEQQLKADTSGNKSNESEVNQLRKQLASYESELEDLKERYKELDEECETCAVYLRERDGQCMRLKKEKIALEHQVLELKNNLKTPNADLLLKPKPSVAHVSVNTDEDWTNLHAVVVDRMSYDAEVEKNKKLTKTIEELRFTKLDLKNTLAKMQKALEKNSSKDNSRELESTKQELRACKKELEDLKSRYKELDEECETCAGYLKEREEQCRRLREAKAALEVKLQELQNDSHAFELTKTARKKRQTFHDMNRPETTVVNQTDASTETTDDLSCSRMERDDRTQEAPDESINDANELKKMVHKLTNQKTHLEQQLRAANAAHPMFVATGSAIVQNQQITDVMKENQKLKKINAKLVNICKKRGKSANRENEDPCEQG